MTTHEAFQQIPEAMNAAILGQEVVVERLLAGSAFLRAFRSTVIHNRSAGRSKPAGISP